MSDRDNLYCKTHTTDFRKKYSKLPTTVFFLHFKLSQCIFVFIHVKENWDEIAFDAFVHISFNLICRLYKPLQKLFHLLLVLLPLPLLSAPVLLPLLLKLLHKLSDLPSQ